jgi:hypothetical protein
MKATQNKTPHASRDKAKRITAQVISNLLCHDGTHATRSDFISHVRKVDSAMPSVFAIAL